MTFTRTADAALIKATITHPRNYKWQTDEHSPAPEDFEPPTGVLYVAVHDGTEYLGLFCLVPHDPITWEIHTCLLPNAYGRALEAYRVGIRWVWANTNRSVILGRIRRENRLALRVAKRAGLREEIGRAHV